MDEVEKFFRCPCCRERISMLLDVSTEGAQTYVEDCEVCCRPLQIAYEAEDGKVRGFSVARS